MKIYADASRISPEISPERYREEAHPRDSPRDMQRVSITAFENTVNEESARIMSSAASPLLVRTREVREEGKLLPRDGDDMRKTAAGGKDEKKAYPMPKESITVSMRRITHAGIVRGSSLFLASR